MTDNQMYTLFSDAGQQPRDAYISDWALSSMFTADGAEAAPVDMELVEQLGRLWDAVNVPFDRLLQLLGLNITQCHRRFCIPYRTVQNWSLGERKAPEYLRLMMAESTGWLTLRSTPTVEG